MIFSNQPSSLDGADQILRRDTSSSPHLAAGQETFTDLSSIITTSTAVVPQSDYTSVPNAGVATTTSAGASQGTSSSGDNGGGTTQSNSGGDRTTVIILSTVLSVFGCLAIAAVIWICIRCNRKRARLFNRGITPIDDDEIETWKGHRREKDLEASLPQTPAPTQARLDSRGHQKQESTSSTKKPASVIVYARRSEEQSPRSPSIPSHFPKRSLDGGKTSLDKELPFTPIQARAPNAREGLTDEAVPGDEPFVPGPKRRTSRLSKTPRTPRLAHMRNKSSRSSSSLHNLGGDGGFFAGYDSDGYRVSHEIYPTHSRVSSDVPPRLSLSDDWPTGGGGLSPRPFIPAEEIGRAIG